MTAADAGGISDLEEVIAAGTSAKASLELWYRLIVEAITELRLTVDLGSVELGRAPQEYVATGVGDRKSTRLNSSHGSISYAVFCLKKKTDCAPPSRRPCRPRCRW